MQLASTFAQVMGSIRRFFRARPSPTRARVARLAVECLEERCLTSVLFGMNGTGGSPPVPPARPVGTLVVTLHSRPNAADGQMTGADLDAHGTPLSLASFPHGKHYPNRRETSERRSAPSSWKPNGKAAAGDDHPKASPLRFGPVYGLSPVRGAGPLDGGGDPSGDPPGPGSSAYAPGGNGGPAPSLDLAGTAPIEEPNVPSAVVSDPVSPTGSGSVSSLAGSDRPGLQAVAEPSPVVLPRLVGVPSYVSPDSLSDSQVNTFRISRFPVSDTTLEVRYTLNAYSSVGCAGYEGVATISRGANHVHVPIELTSTGQVNECEIVTLTLRDGNHYRIGRPTTTLFLAGNARGCSDAALFAAYRQAQSVEAFSALVERHRPAVLRICHGILGNWVDAEDVSQGVFLALAQRPAQWLVSAPGWLHTVARNAALAFLRSRNRRTRHERRAAKLARVAFEETSHELREELDTALTQLPAPLREAVRLRYLEGLSQREAAQALGCPRGTLSQRAAQGVRCLRNVLANGTIWGKTA
jgi:RNA polymerase sigma factor (sigma-70 family)